MRGKLLGLLLWALWLIPAQAWTAEITDVLDAADEEDPIDINVDVNFHSTLNRAKITHEYMPEWMKGTQWAITRPDFNELRYQEQTYAMDYRFRIGLYHDLELSVNLPWIIDGKKQIGFVKGVTNGNSSMYHTLPDTAATNPNCDPLNAARDARLCFQNILAVDPRANPSTQRSGIGDMTLGLKWAPFNDERDDTKSVWIIGLDYIIPSGKLNRPAEIVAGATGGVGLGHHVLTPYFLFSHRFKVLDPYVGLHGSLPIQGKEAKDAGLQLPYSGGFLTGMELVPWENKDKHQKFAIDIGLTADFIGAIESNGSASAQGTVNELSDFLASPSDLNGDRQLQAQSNYARLGVHLGFVIRAAELVRFRFGASLAHNTEHFITGADPCDDTDGDGSCTGNVINDYRFNTDGGAAGYDSPGFRVRVEETTIFTYWVTGQMTF